MIKEQTGLLTFRKLHVVHQEMEVLPENCPPAWKVSSHGLVWLVWIE